MAAGVMGVGHVQVEKGFTMVFFRLIFFVDVFIMGDRMLDASHGFFKDLILECQGRHIRELQDSFQGLFE